MLAAETGVLWEEAEELLLERGGDDPALPTLLTELLGEEGFQEFAAAHAEHLGGEAGGKGKARGAGGGKVLFQEYGNELTIPEFVTAAQVPPSLSIAKLRAI
jgi:hypothetical protein